MRTGTIWVLAAAGLALLAGCADDDGTPEPEARTTTSTTSTTTPTTATTATERSDPYMDSGRVAAEMAWSRCSATADDIYDEADTRDPTAAAEWYARTYPEELRATVVEACRAGLRDDPLP